MHYSYRYYLSQLEQVKKHKYERLRMYMYCQFVTCIFTNLRAMMERDANTFANNWRTRYQ